MTNAIKSCKAALSEAVTLPEGWVSVEDRLPKEGDAVLIYSTDCSYTAYWQKNKWVCILSGYDGFTPSHWRTLPAAPTCEKES